MTAELAMVLCIQSGEGKRKGSEDCHMNDLQSHVAKSYYSELDFE